MRAARARSLRMKSLWLRIDSSLFAQLICFLEGNNKFSQISRNLEFVSGWGYCRGSVSDRYCFCPLSLGLHTCMCGVCVCVCYSMYACVYVCTLRCFAIAGGPSRTAPARSRIASAGSNASGIRAYFQCLLSEH